MSHSVCLLFPEFYEGFIMRKVPLGLAYLASSLKKRNIRTEAYNLNVDSLSEIDFSSFEWVGITCLTPFLPIVNDMCRYIRDKNPSAKIVVGGAHPTYRSTEVFSEVPLISYAISGEGEDALPELILNEGNFRTIAGVYYRDDNGRIAGTPPKRPDIHTLPYPDQRLFDHGRLEKRNPFRSILASRGCPWKCFNCQPILNKVQPVRLRKPEDVFGEIKYLQETYGQDYFGFLDSEFPLRKDWMEKLYRLIKDSGLKFAFHCNCRSDLLDEDILRIFKDLNISRLAIGVESGVERVVNKILHKDIDLVHTRKIFELAQSIGVRTHAHFMIGIPGETLDDMRATLEYAKTVAAQSVEFNMLTPWPGTSFYELCIAKNYLTEKDTGKFNEKRVCLLQSRA